MSPQQTSKSNRHRFSVKPARLLMLLLIPLQICTTAEAAKAHMTQRGQASYYADSLDGNPTASGVVYDKRKLTAAHRSLPFGAKVRVTYLPTGKSVNVVINDRGPFAKRRIIDLSKAAANKIGLTDDGHGEVKLEVIQLPKEN